MDKSVNLIVGHRGVGKTSLLKSLEKLAKEKQLAWVFFDLDEEVAKRFKKNVFDLFLEGESRFREFEASTLSTLIAEAQKKVSEHKVEKVYISLGAGFEGQLPDFVHVIWLRRDTDSSGRVFRNRPRLNPSTSLMSEYQERFSAREAKYKGWAHETLQLPEGVEDFPSLQMQDFFLEKPAKPWDLHFASLTVQPSDFRNWPYFLQKHLAWNLKYLEIRDDWLTEEQIELAVKTIPAGKIYFSRRVSSGRSWPRQLDLINKEKKQVALDWPLELGDPPDEATFLSLHNGSLDEALTRFESYRIGSFKLKLSVAVETFQDLLKGHQWYLQDPTRRSFLPRSKNGRWRWYRSLFGPRMPIHFIREGQGSSIDQPWLWQAVYQPPFDKHFAAVLGHPIHHSRSPIEHFDSTTPFVAINVDENEWDSALPILKILGLRNVAVTSPLKKQAYLHSTHPSPTAQELFSANTLCLKEDQILAHNTDEKALADIAKNLSFDTVWLWGGGGIKSSVRSIWAQVIEISAREGTTRTDNPDLLIWAVDRSREFKWPPNTLRPKLVLDLNYAENSPGLEWAANLNLPYKSGLEMFKRQAQYQKEFWKGC